MEVHTGEKVNESHKRKDYMCISVREGGGMVQLQQVDVAKVEEF